VGEFGIEFALFSSWKPRADFASAKYKQGAAQRRTDPKIGGTQMEIIKNMKKQNEKGFTLIELLGLSRAGF